MQDRALARINTIDALTFPSLGEKNNGRSKSGFSSRNEEQDEGEASGGFLQERKLREKSEMMVASSVQLTAGKEGVL